VLAALVAFIVLVLIVSGVLVILGPRTLARHIRSLGMPARMPAVLEPRRATQAPQAINPKTQRVLVAAARLAAWLRAHGHEEAAREIRNASARMTANEASGLYALQTTLRRIRVVNVTDGPTHERLQALVDELRSAVQDRFEQLELLPFRKP
jgi:hypothetical protein